MFSGLDGLSQYNTLEIVSSKSTVSIDPKDGFSKAIAGGKGCKRYYERCNFDCYSFVIEDYPFSLLWVALRYVVTSSYERMIVGVLIMKALGLNYISVQS